MKYDLSKDFDVNRFRSRAEKLIKDKRRVDLTETRPVRTIHQNKYLHVCINLFAIHFGYTLEEAKTHLKRSCGFMTYDKNGETFLTGTSTLNTLELTKFIDWIRTYSHDNGCYIPTAEEYIVHQFDIEKEIEANQSYL